MILELNGFRVLLSYPRGPLEGAGLANLTSQRHHTHVTDIAENAINVIIMMVESLSDEHLTG